MNYCFVFLVKLVLRLLAWRLQLVHVHEVPNRVVDVETALVCGDLLNFSIYLRCGVDVLYRIPVTQLVLSTVSQSWHRWIEY